MVRFLAFIGVVAIGVAVAAAVFFFGGFYSVAAKRRRSCAGRAHAHPGATSLDCAPCQRPGCRPRTRSAVEAGARAYATRGCVNCHGAPGAEWATWSEGMRPDPRRSQGSLGRAQAGRAVLGDQERQSA